MSWARSQPSNRTGVIHFDLDGIVLDANENFLNALGYSHNEVLGKHHRTFVDPTYAETAEYHSLWSGLRQGEYRTDTFKRVGKGGKEVWIQASYNPIFDMNGKPFKVVKFATDITRQVLVRMGNERVRSMMELVAAGAEELNASVREISEAMAKSKDTATAAVGRVENADTQAQRLSQAAQAMSGIVQMIGDITGQINLLALNATIEFGARRRSGSWFCGRRI